MDEQKVSCIIPAYNEAKRIGAVLEVVCKHNYVQEVIVVDDGSNDNTKELFENDSRIRFISYKENQGKTHAVLEGMKLATENLVMLLDADLIGLSAKEIDQLIKPVISNETDITISLRGNSLNIYKKLGLDIFSGERVFNKKLIRENEDELKRLSGFGLEVFMNSILIKNKSKIKIISWPNVSHARKQEKVGKIKGFFAEARMIKQIFKIVGIHTIVDQFKKISQLRVK